MAHDSPAPHSPPEAPKRPKGILKNTHSHSSEHAPQVSLAFERQPPTNESAITDGTDGVARPPMPNRELSEKEVTQMNTEFNAGGHRRNSSNPRGSSSRRQSATSTREDIQDEHGQRLKWDEANLYLNEGQMGGRMKIDEPKTPYAGRYDPAEDDAEMSMLNAEDIAVDELEMDGAKHHHKKPKDAEIPSLDLGEPEVDPKARRESDGDKKVIVESDDMAIDGVGHHGEDRPEDMSAAEREKHKKFEEMRKKHYEMHNVKNLLGHAEDPDEDE